MKNIFKIIMSCLLAGIFALGNFAQTEASQIPKEFSDKIILAEKLDHEHKVPTINTGAFFMNTTYEIIKHSGYIHKDWLYGALAVDIKKSKDVITKVEPLVVFPAPQGMSVSVRKEYENKKVETDILFSVYTDDTDRNVTYSLNGETRIEENKDNKIEKNNYHWRTSDMVKDYHQLVYKYYEDETRMSFIVLSPFCLLPDKEN